MNKSEQVDQLASALAKAQGEMKNPPKDGANPHFGSRFATLAGVREAVLPVLSRHGLAVIQSAGTSERGPTLTTLLLHTSGQWVETDALTLPAAKQDPQGYCSALTYARRYGLMTLVGVVGDDDDDGNAASRPAAVKPAKAPPKKANGHAARNMPADGAELEARLAKFDERLAADGLCAAGELLDHVRTVVVAAGYVPDLVRWPAPAIELAVTEATAFRERCRAGMGPVHAGGTAK